MPTVRSQINNNGFSRLNAAGRNAFSRDYIAGSGSKQPKFRGSIPKSNRWSLGDEGIRNHRDDYNRAVSINKSAYNSRKSNTIGLAQSIGRSNFSNNIYDGNAARKLQAVPKTIPADVNKEKSAPKIKAIKGSAPQKGIIQTTALSPMFLTIAKTLVIVFLFIAVLAFVRVCLTSATVSTGIKSQNIQSQMSEELLKNNTLEVKNSSLGNSSRIRQAALDYSLITPGAISVINLSPDVLSYDDNNKVSLVESLNRVAQTAK